MKEIKNKDIGFNNESMLTDLSLHSEEIKKKLENVNMEPWYYIYENFVNPELRKQKHASENLMGFKDDQAK